MGGTVRYSEAQLARLAAMALVPWVRRREASAPPPSADAKPLVVPVETPPVPAEVPPMLAPMPREPSVLAGWLAGQPLAAAAGDDDAAPLLVVVEPAPGAADADTPLAGEARALFDRMLGAIGLGRGDVCLRVLAAGPSPDAPTVAALAAAPRRATLALVRELEGTLDAEGCRLADAALGAAWCLPHPERLLEAPLGKRQAWAVLKALGRHLGKRP